VGGPIKKDKTFFFFDAGNTGTGGGTKVLSSAVPVKEEEGLVLLYWSADGAAILVAPQGWNLVTHLVGEPVVGVQLLVAQEIVDAAVEIVSPRAEYHVD